PAVRTWWSNRPIISRWRSPVRVTPAGCRSVVSTTGLLSSPLAQGCTPRVVDFVLIELGCAELDVAWQVAKLPAPPAIFAVRGCDRRAGDISLTRLGALGLLDSHGDVTPELHR